MNGTKCDKRANSTLLSANEIRVGQVAAAAATTAASDKRLLLLADHQSQRSSSLLSDCQQCFCHCCCCRRCCGHFGGQRNSVRIAHFSEPDNAKRLANVVSKNSNEDKQIETIKASQANSRSAKLLLKSVYYNSKSLHKDELSSKLELAFGFKTIGDHKQSDQHQHFKLIACSKRKTITSKIEQNLKGFESKDKGKGKEEEEEEEEEKEEEELRRVWDQFDVQIFEAPTKDAGALVDVNVDSQLGAGRSLVPDTCQRGAVDAVARLLVGVKCCPERRPTTLASPRFLKWPPSSKQCNQIDNGGANDHDKKRNHLKVASEILLCLQALEVAEPSKTPRRTRLKNNAKTNELELKLMFCHLKSGRSCGVTGSERVGAENITSEGRQSEPENRLLLAASPSKVSRSSRFGRRRCCGAECCRCCCRQCSNKATTTKARVSSGSGPIEHDYKNADDNDNDIEVDIDQAQLCLAGPSSLAGAICLAHLWANQLIRRDGNLDGPELAGIGNCRGPTSRPDSPTPLSLSASSSASSESEPEPEQATSLCSPSSPLSRGFSWASPDASSASSITTNTTTSMSRRRNSSVNESGSTSCDSSNSSSWSAACDDDWRACTSLLCRSSRRQSDALNWSSSQQLCSLKSKAHRARNSAASTSSSISASSSLRLPSRHAKYCSTKLTSLPKSDYAKRDEHQSMRLVVAQSGSCSQLETKASSSSRRQSDEISPETVASPDAEIQNTSETCANIKRASDNFGSITEPRHREQRLSFDSKLNWAQHGQNSLQNSDTASKQDALLNAPISGSIRTSDTAIGQHQIHSPVRETAGDSPNKAAATQQVNRCEDKLRLKTHLSQVEPRNLLSPMDLVFSRATTSSQHLDVRAHSFTEASLSQESSSLVAQLAASARSRSLCTEDEKTSELERRIKQQQQQGHGLNRVVRQVGRRMSRLTRNAIDRLKIISSSNPNLNQAGSFTNTFNGSDLRRGRFNSQRLKKVSKLRVIGSNCYELELQLPDSGARKRSGLFGLGRAGAGGAGGGSSLSLRMSQDEKQLFAPGGVYMGPGEQCQWLCQAGNSKLDEAALKLPSQRTNSISWLTRPLFRSSMAHALFGGSASSQVINSNKSQIDDTDGLPLAGDCATEWPKVSRACSKQQQQQQQQQHQLVVIRVGQDESASGGKAINESHQRATNKLDHGADHKYGQLDEANDRTRRKTSEILKCDERLSETTSDLTRSCGPSSSVGLTQTTKPSPDGPSDCADHNKYYNSKQIHRASAEVVDWNQQQQQQYFRSKAPKTISGSSFTSTNLNKSRPEEAQVWHNRTLTDNKQQQLIDSVDMANTVPPQRSNAKSWLLNLTASGPRKATNLAPTSSSPAATSAGNKRQKSKSSKQHDQDQQQQQQQQTFNKENRSNSLTLNGLYIRGKLVDLSKSSCELNLCVAELAEQTSLYLATLNDRFSSSSHELTLNTQQAKFHSASSGTQNMTIMTRDNNQRQNSSSASTGNWFSRRSSSRQNLDDNSNNWFDKEADNEIHRGEVDSLQLAGSTSENWTKQSEVDSPGSNGEQLRQDEPYGANLQTTCVHCQLIAELSNHRKSAYLSQLIADKPTVIKSELQVEPDAQSEELESNLQQMIEHEDQAGEDQQNLRGPSLILTACSNEGTFDDDNATSSSQSRRLSSISGISNKTSPAATPNRTNVVIQLQDEPASLRRSSSSASSCASSTGETGPKERNLQMLLSSSKLASSELALLEHVEGAESLRPESLGHELGHELDDNQDEDDVGSNSSDSSSFSATFSTENRALSKGQQQKGAANEHKLHRRVSSESHSSIVSSIGSSSSSSSASFEEVDDDSDDNDDDYEDEDDQEDDDEKSLASKTKPKRVEPMNRLEVPAGSGSANKQTRSNSLDTHYLLRAPSGSSQSVSAAVAVEMVPASQTMASGKAAKRIGHSSLSASNNQSRELLALDSDYEDFSVDDDDDDDDNDDDGVDDEEGDDNDEQDREDEDADDVADDENVEAVIKRGRGRKVSKATAAPTLSLKRSTKVPEAAAAAATTTTTTTTSVATKMAPVSSCGPMLLSVQVNKSARSRSVDISLPTQPGDSYGVRQAVEPVDHSVAAAKTATETTSSTAAMSAAKKKKKTTMSTNMSGPKKSKSALDTSRADPIELELIKKSARGKKFIQGEIKVPYANGETKTLKLFVDWDEKCNNGEHLWVYLGSSSEACYVGESECLKRGPRLSCSACKIIAHTGCIGILTDKIKFICKHTFKDLTVSNPRHLKELQYQNVIYHHWVHRRTHCGRCKHCTKTIGNTKLPFSSKEIQAITCSWCKVSFHNKENCYTLSTLTEPCTLGVHRESIIPPSWIVKVPVQSSAADLGQDKNHLAEVCEQFHGQPEQASNFINLTSNQAGVNENAIDFYCNDHKENIDYLKHHPQHQHHHQQQQHQSSNQTMNRHNIKYGSSATLTTDTSGYMSADGYNSNTPIGGFSNNKSEILIDPSALHATDLSIINQAQGQRLNEQAILDNASHQHRYDSSNPSNKYENERDNTSSSYSLSDTQQLQQQHFNRELQLKKPRHDINTFKNFKIIPHPTPGIPNAGSKPVLVFVNPRSGGNQGAKMMQKFNWLLNPRQVFDLIQSSGPRAALELYRDVPNLRILTIGGDGTASWILSHLDDVGISNKIPVAVLPLGTGNDLARALGWGGGYADEPIAKILAQVRDGEVVQLDRWNLHVERNYEATPSSPNEFSSTSSGTNMEFSSLPSITSSPSSNCGTIASTMSILDQASNCDINPNNNISTNLSGPNAIATVLDETGCDRLPMDVINNYFSFGVDAHIALEFHTAREAHPERFNSRLRNKMFYGQAGGKDLLKRKWKDLSNFVTLFCDGQDMTSRLKELKVHSVLFLNIPSYGGGTRPWPTTTTNFAKPRTDDGLIEVIGLTTYQLPLLQAGGHGTCIAQCRNAKIITSRTIPMQVDGEPCKLLPSIITINFKNRVCMLSKQKGSHPQKFN